MKKPTNRQYFLLVLGSLVGLWVFVQLTGGPDTPKRQLAHQVANMPRGQIIDKAGNVPPALVEATEDMSREDFLRMEQAYHDDIRNNLNDWTPEEAEAHWQAFKAAYRARLNSTAAGQVEKASRP